MRTPIWIEEREVLAIHARLLSLHGGGAGVRDRGLLQPALARLKQHFAYQRKSDPVSRAAVYCAAIVRNHPFVDGNKRTGFVVGVLFLEMNGYRFTATEEEAARAVMALAAGEIREEGYAAFLRANVRRSRVPSGRGRE